MHLNDFFLPPLKKLLSTFTKDKTANWFFQTRDYVNVYDANGLLENAIHDERPLMVTRIGSSELHTILNYLSLRYSTGCKIKKYLAGVYPEFWPGTYFFRDLINNSGFFPAEKRQLYKFSELFLNDMRNADILLTWLRGEKYLFENNYLDPNIRRVYLYDCEPYFEISPWTLALKGKKVLVLHPFEQSIQLQYRKREKLFRNEVLPEFELKTCKVNITLPGNPTIFNTWFDALADLKKRVADIDFDVALIGAGAYGLPIASYIKNIGKKAIHLGGFLQILFGIRGNRWEQNTHHSMLINEFWSFPLQDEYPMNYRKLDHGSYWKK